MDMENVGFFPYTCNANFSSFFAVSSSSSISSPRDENVSIYSLFLSNSFNGFNFPRPANKLTVSHPVKAVEYEESFHNLAFGAVSLILIFINAFSNAVYIDDSSLVTRPIKQEE